NAAVLAKTGFATTAAKPTPVQAPFWTGKPDAKQFAAREDEAIARAKADVAKMLAVSAARTMANTLEPYNDALTELAGASGQSGLMEEVHPDSAMRAEAEAASRRVNAYSTELSLDRKVYDALKTMDLTGADAETRYFVERTLRDYRLAGVDRDD